ncbi:MAG: cysteine synthase family protein [Thaumarchaeota archaeon]|nr:cysteine synthase family protein [Candidatus Calditenuaceae archaeon]MDW8187308.1 cysteine synthase family protein [Nitrososphaerota archaeon]
MKSHDSILDAIGNTPLVKLQRIPRSVGLEEDLEVLVKLENLNPSGSLKDRIYREMLTKAIESGDLREGMEILEVSTGNAGIACSFVGTVLGFKVKIVIPEGVSVERRQLIRAYGGEVLLTPGGESDVDISMAKVRQMLTSEPNRYWFPNQFDNPNNPRAHYKTTAPEIWEQSGKRIDAYVVSYGTGGLVSGVGRYLREKDNRVRVYAVEPSECAVIAEGRWGRHKIEGVGDGFVPKNLEPDLLSGIVLVSSEEAIEMAARLVREEGVFCGISSGANVAAALKLAKANPDLRRIVTVICDSGDRYLSTEVFGHQRGLPVVERTVRLDDYSRQVHERLRDRIDVIR